MISINAFHQNHMKKSQQGISLIEVLISIIVMTFGLLGISGLMMSGVNNSTGSDLASRANQSASEIMDAMRANRGNAASYVITYGTATTTITGTTTADTDRKQWREAIERLPAGASEITATAVANTYIVKIKFANCLGTLNEVEMTACKNNAATSRREIIYTFQV
jgi:type IV pilus assembly protein PilV